MSPVLDPFFGDTFLPIKIGQHVLQCVQDCIESDDFESVVWPLLSRFEIEGARVKEPQEVAQQFLVVARESEPVTITLLDSMTYVDATLSGRRL